MNPENLAANLPVSPFVLHKVGVQHKAVKLRVHVDLVIELNYVSDLVVAHHEVELLDNAWIVAKV